MARGFLRRTATTVAHSAGHLLPRDRRLWVFGNIKGFRDNPRYLAEHIVNNHPDIAVWWVARSTVEADAAMRAGLSVAMLGTSRAARTQLRAGVAFLSNAFIDLEPAYLGGASIVHLYHGLGLKKILLDLDVGKLVHAGGVTRALAGLQRWSVRRRLAQIDLVIAAGEFARQHFATGFGLPVERIPAVGTPRFDVIHGEAAYARLVSGDLRAQLQIATDAHVVLWLPTWREAGDASWLPTLQRSDVDELLGGSRVLLLIKTHPYADRGVFATQLPDHACIRLLDEAEVDVNCLLRIADVLVTDYSSAAFDYALLRRPIHFFAPDAAGYDDRRGLYEPYHRLTGGMEHADWPSLLGALAAASRGDDAQGMASAARVADLARNNEEPGNCERITQLVAGRAGLRLASPRPTGR
jgi:CDP-glycerol glycerophosphotransferase